jgi:uncharacterized membrane protein
VKISSAKYKNDKGGSGGKARPKKTVFNETLPFFGFSLYEMSLMFIFWSFIGWMLEVVTMTFQIGEYQNRGFLNMPICPIYGVGVILAVTFFRPIADTWILLFLASSVLCTALELAVGLILEKLFQNRWWDYTMYRFNFKGLICLWVSVGWGIGCIIVVKFVQPAVVDLIDKIPKTAGYVFLIIMAVLIVIDLASSLRAAINLTIQLRRIDEISALMLKSAQGLGKKLASGTQKFMSATETAKEKAGEVREKASEVAGEVRGKASEVAGEVRGRASEIRTDVSDDLKERLEAIINTRNRAVLRLLKAFPTMKSRRYMRALRLLQYRYKVKYLPQPEEKEEKS